MRGKSKGRRNPAKLTNLQNNIKDTKACYADAKDGQEVPQETSLQLKKASSKKWKKATYFHL